MKIDVGNQSVNISFGKIVKMDVDKNEGFSRVGNNGT